MRLLLLTNNYENYPPFASVHAYIQELRKAFPGSRAYGPGFPDYETNDAQGILEQLGGADKFDAVYCFSLERPLLGEPIHAAVAKSCPEIPARLWTFPVNLGKVRLPKLLQPADFWHCTSSEWTRILIGHGFDYVNSSMLPPFMGEKEFHNTFSEEIRERVIFIPSSVTVDENRFKDFGAKKEHTVIMAGAQLPRFYPVRAKMLEAFRRADIGLLEPKHPGYDSFLQYNPYPRLLNASRISAFCSGRFHLAMAKLVEAMACRCAALCNYFYGAEHMGLVPGEHFILADETTCVQAAKEFLRDPQRLEALYDAAQKVVMERHTFAVRAAEMARWLPALINREKPVSWARLSPNLNAVRARNRMADRVAPDSTYHTETHVLDEKPECAESTWRYWNYLGSLKKVSPNEYEGRELTLAFVAQTTAFSWLQIIRGEYLKKLAREAGAENILEIGTGMGFQSVVWAGWLLAEGGRGRVVTLDTIGHDEPLVCSSPQLFDRVAVRRKLWEGMPESERILFVHRGHEEIPSATPFDLVFIDQDNTFASVIDDFNEIRPLLHPKSVVVVNNYCSAFPGVMDAVNYLARKNGMTVKRVSFQPAPDGLAVCAFL